MLIFVDKLAYNIPLGILLILTEDISRFGVNESYVVAMYGDVY